MPTKLKSIQLRGWRSIADAWTPAIQIGDLNVILGANGAGKSNLLAFFSLLHALVEGRLREFVGIAGGASSQLTGGPKRTPVFQANLIFESDRGQVAYVFNLSYAAGDTLVFTLEHVRYKVGGAQGTTEVAALVPLGTGHSESLLLEAAKLKNEDGETAALIRDTLLGWRSYHFHDTSPQAGIKQQGETADNLVLKADASNLAAFLLRLRQEAPDSYEQIRATINLAAPFFLDFVLEEEGPGKSRIRLRWRAKNSDVVFGAHQLSDGTLRFMCLTALLCQPEVPRLVVIDEPELGLHPFAIQLLGEMLKDAAERAQILVATQSPSLVDAAASVEDLIIGEHLADGSHFQRKDEKELEAWLNDYSLGQLWMKNILGGGPRP